MNYPHCQNMNFLHTYLLERSPIGNVGKTASKRILSVFKPIVNRVFHSHSGQYQMKCQDLNSNQQ